MIKIGSEIKVLKYDKKSEIDTTGWIGNPTQLYTSDSKKINNHDTLEDVSADVDFGDDGAFCVEAGTFNVINL